MENEKKAYKRMRFVDEYMIDYNGSQACIRAGYSEKSSEDIAQRLLKREDVSAEIQRRTMLITSKKIATAQELLEMLTVIARGDDTEECVVLQGKGGGVSRAKIVNKKVVPKDKLKAIELLGKAHQMFVERIKIEDAPKILDDIPETPDIEDEEDE